MRVSADRREGRIITQVQRISGEYAIEPASVTLTRHHFDAEGPIAALQANLARQLWEHDVAVCPVERLTQLCSKTSGFVTLASAYAITGMMILSWL